MLIEIPYEIGDEIIVNGEKAEIKGLHCFVNQTGELTNVRAYIGPGGAITLCDAYEINKKKGEEKMATKKRLIVADMILAGIATFKECYNGVDMKPWVVEHIQTALDMVERFVKETPTVDAVEVVHGRWIEWYPRCT